MFMRYYGGGVGHRGMGAPSLSTFDDEEPDPQWQDVIPDTAELDAEVPAAVEHAEDLIRLAVLDPEASEDHLDEAIAEELAALQNATVGSKDAELEDTEDAEPEEWELEDDDGRAHALGNADDDAATGNEDMDVYSMLGYAAL